MTSTDPGAPSGELPPEPLRRRVRARVIGGLVRGAGVLPPWALGAALRPAGSLAFRSRYGDALAHNLERMLPAIETKNPVVAARVRDHSRFGRDVAHFAVEQALHWIRLARGAAPGEPSGAWVDDLVALDPSIERLDAALAEGRGAIVVTAHIGNWELLCARLRRRGVHGAVVGRVRRLDSSHQWLGKMRNAYSVTTIAQDAHPREALAVLRSGGVLGLLTDLHVRRIHGTSVPFFGVPAHTPTAVASLARLSGAPIVPVRCVRTEDHSGYRISAEPSDRFDRNAPRAEETLRLLSAQNRTFERWIVASPEQWAWHQRRWPDPVPSVDLA